MLFSLLQNKPIAKLTVVRRKLLRKHPIIASDVGVFARALQFGQ